MNLIPQPRVSAPRLTCVFLSIFDCFAMSAVTTPINATLQPPMELSKGVEPGAPVVSSDAPAMDTETVDQTSDLSDNGGSANGGSASGQPVSASAEAAAGTQLVAHQAFEALQLSLSDTTAVLGLTKSLTGSDRTTSMDAAVESAKKFFLTLVQTPATAPLHTVVKEITSSIITQMIENVILPFADILVQASSPALHVFDVTDSQGADVKMLYLRTVLVNLLGTPQVNSCLQDVMGTTTSDLFSAVAQVIGFDQCPSTQEGFDVSKQMEQACSETMKSAIAQVMAVVNKKTKMVLGPQDIVAMTDEVVSTMMVQMAVVGSVAMLKFSQYLNFPCLVGLKGEHPGFAVIPCRSESKFVVNVEPGMLASLAATMLPTIIGLEIDLVEQVTSILAEDAQGRKLIAELLTSSSPTQPLGFLLILSKLLAVDAPVNAPKNNQDNFVVCIPRKMIPIAVAIDGRVNLHEASGSDLHEGVASLLAEEADICKDPAHLLALPSQVALVVACTMCPQDFDWGTDTVKICGAAVKRFGACIGETTVVPDPLAYFAILDDALYSTGYFKIDSAGGYAYSAQDDRMVVRTPDIAYIPSGLNGTEFKFTVGETGEDISLSGDETPLELLLVATMLSEYNVLALSHAWNRPYLLIEVMHALTTVTGYYATTKGYAVDLGKDDCSVAGLLETALGNIVDDDSDDSDSDSDDEDEDDGAAMEEEKRSVKTTAIYKAAEDLDQKAFKANLARLLMDYSTQIPDVHKDISLSAGGEDVTRPRAPVAVEMAKKLLKASGCSPVPVQVYAPQTCLATVLSGKNRAIVGSVSALPSWETVSTLEGSFVPLILLMHQMITNFRKDLGETLFVVPAVESESDLIAHFTRASEFLDTLEDPGDCDIASSLRDDFPSDSVQFHCLRKVLGSAVSSVECTDLLQNGLLASMYRLLEQTCLTRVDILYRASVPSLTEARAALVDEIANKEYTHKGGIDRDDDQTTCTGSCFEMMKCEPDIPSWIASHEGEDEDEDGKDGKDGKGGKAKGNPQHGLGRVHRITTLGTQLPPISNAEEALAVAANLPSGCFTPSAFGSLMKQYPPESRKLIFKAVLNAHSKRADDYDLDTMHYVVTFGEDDDDDDAEGVPVRHALYKEARDLQKFGKGCTLPGGTHNLDLSQTLGFKLLVNHVILSRVGGVDSVAPFLSPAAFGVLGALDYQGTAKAWVTEYMRLAVPQEYSVSAAPAEGGEGAGVLVPVKSVRGHSQAVAVYDSKEPVQDSLSRFGRDFRCLFMAHINPVVLALLVNKMQEGVQDVQQLVPQAGALLNKTSVMKEFQALCQSKDPDALAKMRELTALIQQAKAVNEAACADMEALAEQTAETAHEATWDFAEMCAVQTTGTGGSESEAEPDADDDDDTGGGSSRTRAASKKRRNSSSTSPQKAKRPRGTRSSARHANSGRK